MSNDSGLKVMISHLKNSEDLLDIEHVDLCATGIWCISVKNDDLLSIIIVMSKYLKVDTKYRS